MVLREGLGRRGPGSKNKLKWKEKKVKVSLGGGVLYCWMMAAFPSGKLGGLFRVVSAFRQVAVGPTGNLLIPGIYRLSYTPLKGNSHFI